MTPDVPQTEWTSFLSDHPDCHLLQSSTWGDLKASFGWEVTRVVNKTSGAQILFRSLPLGFSIAYVPKGPIGAWLPTLLPELDRICRDHNAIFLKVEPDSGEDQSTAEHLLENGFVKSSQTVQPLQTLIVPLRGSQEEILARMKQKTRYNIRLAERKGVVIRPWDDLQAFCEMIQETGERDGFGVHASDYYKTAYELFRPQGACELFVAEYDQQPLAAVFVFASGNRAWYFYGASSGEERNRMPNYLLQWHAMKWAIKKGCTQYDLWGIPPDDEATLEREFTSRRDGLWGVYRFKRGFGGDIHRTLGAWDRPYHQTLYSLLNALGTRFWNR